MDATDRHDERDHRAPLYDQRFEHDACGVGFVADAGGGSQARVLPLALAGLAALAHRGAFAADGESSDGAGVAMPLSASLLSLVAGARAAERPGVVMLFLPRGAGRGAGGTGARRAGVRGCRPAGRSLAIRAVRAGGARGGCRVVASGRGPGDRRAAGRRVGRVVRTSAGRRPAAPGDGGAGYRRCRRRVVGAIGVVPDRRLQGPGRRRTRLSRAVPGPAGARRSRVHGLPPAVRNEHHARLAARSAVPVDRPQRRDQHGPRQPRAGPRADARPRLATDRGRSARRRITAVAGRLGLAVARRGPRVADDDRLGSRPGAAGGDP